MDKRLKQNDVFRVGFLLLDDFALMSYAAAIEPLRAANLLAGRQLYLIRNIPVFGAQAESSGGALVRASAQIGEQIDFDLVLVVAGGDPSGFDDQRVLQWLRLLARRGVMLGGVSGGPLILAKAGLMDDRRMTIHWEYASALSEVSPLLKIERSLYVIDRGRYSCAGGIAPLDMMHEIIAGHHGAEFARRVSDWFMHTEVRASGAPQRAGLVERYGTTSAPVILAIEAMESHVSDSLTLAQLASLAGVGPRQLNRLFSSKLGKGTMQFYRDLRMERAKLLITQSPMPITEIALATGFNSSAHFAKAFRAKFGITPSSLRH